MSEDSKALVGCWLQVEGCWLQVEGAWLWLAGQGSFVLSEWQQADPWGPSSGGLTHLKHWVESALLLSSATSHALLLLGWGLAIDAVGYKVCSDAFASEL